MSQGSTEQQPQGHPAWQELLNELPEDLHPLIKPKLEAWDKGVQDKLQGVHNQYDPYKSFVDNKIDPNVIEQALYIADHLTNKPEEFIRKAIDNFGLADTIFGNNDEDDDVNELDDYTGDDITKHPQFKAVMQQLEQLNTAFTNQQQMTQQEQQEKQWEDTLNELQEQHKDDGEFDRLYVTALVAQGNLEPEAAVQQFYQTVNQAAARINGNGNGHQTLSSNQQQNNQQVTPPVGQQAPVVMGGSGNAGSGSPSEPVSMGSMKNGEIQDLVIQMLEARQNAS